MQSCKEKSAFQDYIPHLLPDYLLWVSLILQKGLSVKHYITYIHYMYDHDRHWCNVCMKLKFCWRKRMNFSNKWEAGGICACNHIGRTSRDTKCLFVMIATPSKAKCSLLQPPICFSLAGSLLQHPYMPFCRWFCEISQRWVLLILTTV